MKIAFTSEGTTLDARLDSRFGRAAWFLIHDTETGVTRALENIQNLNAVQGAGIQAASSVAGAGVQAVVTGHCGPKAFRVLEAAGIPVYLTTELTVAEALRAFEGGKLKPIASADVEGHWS